jgi:hypothetical protein
MTRYSSKQIVPVIAICLVLAATSTLMVAAMPYQTVPSAGPVYEVTVSQVLNAAPPNAPQRVFTPGETVRVTMKIHITGLPTPTPTYKLSTGFFLPDSSDERFLAVYSISNPVEGDNYADFDWPITRTTVAGHYDVVGTLWSDTGDPQNPIIYDTTTPGPNTTTFSGTRVANQFTVQQAATSHLFWLSHVTATGAWHTGLSVYNAGPTSATFQISRYDASGAATGIAQERQVASRTWVSVAQSDLNFEGTAKIASDQLLLAKVTYQYGDSPSVCEFYVTATQGRNWVIPSTPRSWMTYTGIALVNPGDTSISVSLEAWKDGRQVAQYDTSAPLEPKARMALLSDQIWPGLASSEFDTIIVRTAGDVPAPISITGNAAQDRHVFFTAQPEPISP